MSADGVNQLHGPLLALLSFRLLSSHARLQPTPLASESASLSLEISQVADAISFVFREFINQTGCEHSNLDSFLYCLTSLGPDGIAWLLGVRRSSHKCLA
jgi:hypothetical protein